VTVAFSSDTSAHVRPSASPIRSPVRTRRIHMLENLSSISCEALRSRSTSSRVSAVFSCAVCLGRWTCWSGFRFGHDPDRRLESGVHDPRHAVNRIARSPLRTEDGIQICHVFGTELIEPHRADHGAGMQTPTRFVGLVGFRTRFGLMDSASQRAMQLASVSGLLWATLPPYCARRSATSRRSWVWVAA
jgi:hypothetical protein